MNMADQAEVLDALINFLDSLADMFDNGLEIKDYSITSEGMRNILVLLELLDIPSQEVVDRTLSLFKMLKFHFLDLAIDHIPLVQVDQEQVDSLERCSICLVGFTMDKMVMRLKCGHCFDSICLVTWLRDNGSCPLCRYSVMPEDYFPDADLDDTTDEEGSDFDFDTDEEEEGEDIL